MSSVGAEPLIFENVIFVEVLHRGPFDREGKDSSKILLCSNSSIGLVMYE